MQIVIVILLAALVVTGIILIMMLVRQGAVINNMGEGQTEELEDMSYGITCIQAQMEADRKTNAEYNSNLRESIFRVMRDSLSDLQESNERSIDRLQGVVSEKLDKSLNERLDSNFKQVGDQLGNLYKSLGEIKDLSSGVQDLNKTLSNVKTRGIWGEVQLGRILEQTMTRSQYRENVATKHDSADRVEYAVLVPGESGEEVYLPIDAKFPSDIYNRIVAASEEGNAQELSKAVTELRNRILFEARTIRDKYLDPPYTTSYALMFLPTEGLYAEVLRIDGLTEQCQNLGVLVTGPTTVTAVLNSLQAGFRNISLSKKSVEVMKLLEAIKGQFEKMNEDVERTQKKLQDAMNATDKLQHRTDIIQKRMKNIGEIDTEESDRFLEMEEDWPVGE